MWLADVEGEGTELHRTDHHAGPEGVEDRSSTSITQGHGALAEARLARSALPFVAVALVAQLSAAILPDLRSTGLFVASGAVLACIFAAVLVLPWRRLPVEAQLVVPVGYLASLLLLLMAQDTATSGLRALILLPIMWVALYHRSREGVLITLCAVAVLMVVSLIDHEPFDVAAIRALLWVAIGMLIVLSVHNLRRWLGSAINERDAALREARILHVATEELNATLDPESVIAVATRVAAQTASPPGSEARRASYLAIVGDMVCITGGYDESGLDTSYAWPIADHSYVQDVLRTGSPASGPLSEEDVGGSARAALRDTGIRYGAWVPIRVDGSIHGVLALASRSKPVRRQELARCVSIGHLLELALSNALAHERSKRAAMTDPLTGLVNRRGLQELFRSRRGRRSFGVLSLDVDSLKAVNNHRGHAAGDELLKLTAGAASAPLREGDVLARTGGDEFAAIVFDADEDALQGLAGRILDVVQDAGSGSLQPRVSIGGAYANPSSGATLADITQRADAAMYEAKRAGGMSYVAAGELLTQPA